MPSVTALSACGRLSVTRPAAPRRSNRISDGASVTPRAPRGTSGSPRRRRRCGRRADGPMTRSSCRVSRIGLFRRDRVQAVVGRLDHQQRVGPVGEDQQRADEPAPVARLPRRPESRAATSPAPARPASARRGCSSSAIPSAAALIVEREPRRLLRDVDEDGRAGEHRGEHEREVGCEHSSTPAAATTRRRFPAASSPDR